MLDKEFQIISELKSPKQTWEIPVDGTVPIFSASVLNPGFSALLCLHAAFLFKDFINTAKLILITVIIQPYSEALLYSYCVLNNAFPEYFYHSLIQLFCMHFPAPQNLLDRVLLG